MVAGRRDEIKPTGEEPETNDASPPKPRRKPLAWGTVPPQSLPERWQAIADLRELLASPHREYGDLLKTVANELYLFSGVELRRILKGLLNLLEEGLPKEKTTPCPQCGSNNTAYRWKYFQSGTKHIRAECAGCGRWKRYASKNSKAAIAEADRHPPLTGEVRR